MPSERYLKEIKKKIKEAGEKQLKRLNLNGYISEDEKLTQIPPEVFELEHLEVLNLSYNHLATLPESIEKLQNLTSLDLSGNQLRTLPESIAKLQNFTSLDLRGNHLRTLHESIAKLQNLTSLDLSSNQLRTLPESIAKLQNLTELKLNYNQLTTLPESIANLQNLTSLDLSSNQLRTLPESTAKLQNLTELKLNYNRLTTLPESIAKLQNLTSLDLSSNQLRTLPESIAKLQNLTRLYLYRNQLTTVPESISKLNNLTKLSLSVNKLTTVPESIVKLKNLEVLGLKDNPIESPPPEVVFDKEGRTNIEGIKNYYRVRPVSDIKITDTDTNSETKTPKKRDRGSKPLKGSKETMPNIFISYRRQGSSIATGRIYDKLEQFYGTKSVFMDIDTIPIGVDFREYIDHEVSRCDIMLVIIGERWLEFIQAKKNDPRDFVRIEIEVALKQNIPVVPIFLGSNVSPPSEAELPPSISDLAYRNGIEVDPTKDFRIHMDRLKRALDKQIQG